MISRSRRKLPITVRNTNATGGPSSAAILWAGVACSLLGFALPDSWAAAQEAFASGQTAASATWSSRSSSAWPARTVSAAPAERTTRSSQHLPWRRVNAPSEVSLPAAEGESLFEFPPAAFPEATTTASGGSTDKTAADDPRERARQQLLQTGRRNRPLSNSPHGSAAWDPFGDAGTAGPSTSMRGADPFNDPFGDKAADHQPQSRKTTATGRRAAGEPALFRLASANEEVRVTPSPSLRLTVASGARPASPRIKILDDPQTAPSLQKPRSGRLQLHAPVVAFEPAQASKLGGSLDEPGPPTTSWNPAVEATRLADPQVESLREIPDFEPPTPLEQPPTPESVPGNRELPRPQAGDYDDAQMPTPNSEFQTPDTTEELPRLPGFGEPGERETPEPRPSFRADESSASDNSSPAGKAAERCDRIYNDRDCCREEGNCDVAWREIDDLSLDKISINISPPLSPSSDDEMDTEEQRQRLLDAPTRVWRNFRGHVIAEGTLEDFANDDVIIRLRDGSTKSYSFFDLSEDDTCFVTGWWRIPPECVMDDADYIARDFTMCTFTWKASGVCHKPLYFEEMQLERYGHSAGPLAQPLLSGAHFFASVALLPYNMGVYPPNECRYVLGYYRPGSCAPWMIRAFPLSRRGLAMEALGIWGFTVVY